MGIDPRVLTDMGIWGSMDMTNPQQREEDMRMKPTVQEVRDALWGVYLIGEETQYVPGEGWEVRLQYVPGEGWEVHHGDPSYDLGHKGFWGGSWIEGSMMDMVYLEEVSQDLLAQVEALRDRNGMEQELQQVVRRILSQTIH